MSYTWTTAPPITHRKGKTSLPPPEVSTDLSIDPPGLWTSCDLPIDKPAPPEPCLMGGVLDPTQVRYEYRAMVATAACSTYPSRLGSVSGDYHPTGIHQHLRHRGEPRPSSPLSPRLSYFQAVPPVHAIPWTADQTRPRPLAGEQTIQTGNLIQPQPYQPQGSNSKPP